MHFNDMYKRVFALPDLKTLNEWRIIHKGKKSIYDLLIEFQEEDTP